MLDTSALIGWAERRNPNVEQAIVIDGDRPLVHHVTLGELHTGIARAISGGMDHDVVNARRRTLRIAEMCEITGFGDPVVFGAMAAQSSRRISHNDMWIACVALERGVPLLTEDRALHDAVADRVWSALPGRTLRCVFVGHDL